jgi:hypothetical protein
LLIGCAFALEIDNLFAEIGGDAVKTTGVVEGFESPILTSVVFLFFQSLVDEK